MLHVAPNGDVSRATPLTSDEDRILRAAFGRCGGSAEAREAAAATLRRCRQRRGGDWFLCDCLPGAERPLPPVLVPVSQPHIRRHQDTRWPVHCDACDFDREPDGQREITASYSAAAAAVRCPSRARWRPRRLRSSGRSGRHHSTAGVRAWPGSCSGWCPTPGCNASAGAGGRRPWSTRWRRSGRPQADRGRRRGAADRVPRHQFGTTRRTDRSRQRRARRPRADCRRRRASDWRVMAASPAGPSMVRCSSVGPRSACAARSARSCAMCSAVRSAKGRSGSAKPSARRTSPLKPPSHSMTGSLSSSASRMRVTCAKNVDIGLSQPTTTVRPGFRQGISRRLMMTS